MKKIHYKAASANTRIQLDQCSLFSRMHLTDVPLIRGANNVRNEVRL